MTNLSYRMLQSASTDSMSGRESLAASNFSASASDNLSNSKSSTKSYLEATYEKIRTVGKGAFGTAVLYRRLTDSKMIVLKEINMSELSANERQMALNEVEVLSVLHHPNIISYLGSFEADGMLVIEMEYADGGTLSQFISRAKSPIGELEILTFFKQIVSAIQYMHEHSILHRDLKTANIFLTKDDLVKIGDFGISKVMNTKSQAHTVLGTPYYISPEMCEGKQYDQKSDMWALGCILYEMACREKTFQGSNLPALVNKIMKGSYEPLPTIYSSSLKLMVSDLLQKDPALRPPASVITSRVSQLFEKTKTKMASSKNFSAFKNGSKERSVLYTLSGYGMTFSLIPVPLPPKSKIVEFAISSSHYIALTADSLVYTWGEGKRGQLALDLTPEWVNEPTLAESLMSKSIRQVAAGNGFSVFLGDSGMVLTCGEGTTGCLGHGDFGSQESPRLVGIVPVENVRGVKAKHYIHHPKCTMHAASKKPFHDYGLIVLRGPAQGHGLKVAPVYTIYTLTKMYTEIQAIRAVCLNVGFGYFRLLDNNKTDPASPGVPLHGWVRAVNYLECKDFTALTENEKGKQWNYTEHVSWFCTTNLPNRKEHQSSGDSGGPVTCNNQHSGLVSYSFYARGPRMYKYSVSMSTGFSIFENSAEYREALNVVVNFYEEYDPKAKAFNYRPTAPKINPYSLRVRNCQADSSPAYEVLVVCVVTLIWLAYLGVQIHNPIPLK